MWMFWGTAKLFPKVIAPFKFPPAKCVDSSFSASTPILAIVCLLGHSHPTGHQVASHGGCALPFPDGWCGWASFHALVGHSYFFFGFGQKSISHFKLGYLSLMSCKRSLHILNIRPLSQEWFVDVFCYSRVQLGFQKVTGCYLDSRWWAWGELALGEQRGKPSHPDRRGWWSKPMWALKGIRQSLALAPKSQSGLGLSIASGCFWPWPVFLPSFAHPCLISIYVHVPFPLQFPYRWISSHWIVGSFANPPTCPLSWAQNMGRQRGGRQGDRWTDSWLPQTHRS